MEEFDDPNLLAPREPLVVPRAVQLFGSPSFEVVRDSLVDLLLDVAVLYFIDSLTRQPLAMVFYKCQRHRSLVDEEASVRNGGVPAMAIAARAKIATYLFVH